MSRSLAMTKKILLLLVLPLLALSIAGCSGGQVNPTPTFAVLQTLPPTYNATETTTPSPTSTPMPIAVGPTGFAENVNPLTGLVVSDPSILNRRPVVVKITNFPRSARPQAGLSFADIVFDYYSGGGVNRFAAIFYGQNTTKAGPVRSGRLVDAQLVPMYNGILACGSADQRYVWPTLINELGYYRIFIDGPNSCPALCRDTMITENVNSLFADTAEMTQWAIRRQVDTGERPNLEGNYFNSNPPSTGETAEMVAINYYSRNRGEWHYDSNSGNYLRWIEEVDANDELQMIPHVDRVTGGQLAFSNVIVMFTEYTELSETLHDMNIIRSNGGRAVLFRDGKVIEGTWRVFSRYQPLRFFGTDGEPLALKPGNSWIVIVGINSLLEQSSTGVWEMHFYLP